MSISGSAGATGVARGSRVRSKEKGDGEPEVRAGLPSLGNPIDLLGSRIREVRSDRGMSVRALARLANCSASMLSQIESGRTKPSVSTLYAITSALAISTDSLFGLHRDGESEGRDYENAVFSPAVRNDSGGVEHQLGSLERPGADGSRRMSRSAGSVTSRLVLRRGERPVIDLERGVHWEQLTPDDREQGIEFREVRYDVGGGSAEGAPAIRHNGREYCIVLSGRFAYQIGFERGVLEEGDSLAFDSTMPHRFWNVGKVPVRAIWFVIDRRTASG